VKSGACGNPQEIAVALARGLPYACAAPIACDGECVCLTHQFFESGRVRRAYGTNSRPNWIFRTHLVNKMNHPKAAILSLPLFAVSLLSVCHAQSAAGYPARHGSHRCDPAPVSAQDAAFLKKVNGANLGEMAFSPVVLQHTTDASVTAFAHQMLKDHSNANDAVVALAAEKNVQLPGVVPTKARSDIHWLSQSPEPAFDHMYKRDMIRDHVAAIALFRQEVASGSDPDVVAFARKTLPVLHMHLRMAQALLK